MIINVDKKYKHYIDRLIEEEGGYVHHPLDKGGPTKYGITLATYKMYVANTSADEVTPEDIKELTKDVAAAIYYTRYINIPRLYILPDDIFEQAFDAAVQHGPAQAITLLQRAIGVSEDGILGPVTLEKLESYLTAPRAFSLNAIYLRERLRFYAQIVANNPSQSVFILGWINRVSRFIPGLPITD